jgi:hypothetical protein
MDLRELTTENGEKGEVSIPFAIARAGGRKALPYKIYVNLRNLRFHLLDSRFSILNSILQIHKFYRAPHVWLCRVLHLLF